MPDLTRDLEQTTGDRYRCPFCDARRGLSFDPDEGESGLWHCFSCQRGGDGVELYAELHHADLSEALDAFGISRSDTQRRIKRKEKQAPRPTVPEKSDAEWKELCHIWHAMTPYELELRNEYRRRRALAVHERDREAFDRWHAKWQQLHAHVLRRELKAHEQVDRLDTAYTEREKLHAE